MLPPGSKTCRIQKNRAAKELHIYIYIHISLCSNPIPFASGWFWSGLNRYEKTPDLTGCLEHDRDNYHWDFRFFVWISSGTSGYQQTEKWMTN